SFSVCTRQMRRRLTKPARSKMRKCFETAGKDIRCGFAKSVTQWSPCARCSRMRRRVESASAANVWFNNLGEHLTIWLSVSTKQIRGKNDFRNLSTANFTLSQGFSSHSRTELK